jgi:hypothetical protein
LDNKDRLRAILARNAPDASKEDRLREYSRIVKEEFDNLTVDEVDALRNRADALEAEGSPVDEEGRVE